MNNRDALIAIMNLKMKKFGMGERDVNSQPLRIKPKNFNALAAVKH